MLLMKALLVFLLPLASAAAPAEPALPATSCWILCRDEAACAAACERGDDQRCLALADKLDGAERTKADPIRAAALRETLCKRGNQPACFKLSEMLAQPRGVALDKARAESLAQGACEAGMAEACQQVLRLSPKQSPARARAEAALAKQCDADSADACDVLASQVRARGESDAPNQAVLANLLRKQCAADNGYACQRLLWRLQRAKPPVAKDIAATRRRTLDLLIAACNRGDNPDACISIAGLCGRACTSGGKRYGPSKLRGLAVKQLTGLCEAGDGAECIRVGEQIVKAGGKDAGARALPWFRRACLDGWVDACDSAAARTKPGKPGQAERVALYRKACLLGNEPGCARFGEEVRPERTADPDADGNEADEDDEEPPALRALREEAHAIEARACRRGDWELCSKAVAALEEAEQLDQASPLLELACGHGMGSDCLELGYWHEVMIEHKHPAEEEASALSAYTRACAAFALAGCEQASTLARTPGQRAALRPVALPTALALCLHGDSAAASSAREKQPVRACVLAAVLLGKQGKADPGSPTHQQLAERALELARGGCESGKACPAVADLLADRRLATYDPARAAELRGAACADRYPRQCILLARQYAQGEGVGKDAGKARDLLAARCAKRDIDACGEMAKHGWQMPSAARKREPSKPIPKPVEELELPLKIPGCPGEHCGCIVSNRLAGSATLLEEPKPSARELVEVAPGTLVAHAQIFELIDHAGVVRLGGSCDKSKPDQPGPPVHYLGYAAEGMHMVWRDGRRREVDDCEIAQMLAEPSSSLWVEITTMNSKTGYTPDLGVVQRGMPSAKQSCLP
jgi:TPR repeat protein